MAASNPDVGGKLPTNAEPGETTGSFRVDELLAEISVLKREVTEVIGVAHGYVNQEVVLSAHVVDAYHLIQSQEVGAEGLDEVSGVLGELYRDEGLQPDTQCHGVDSGLKSSQHTAISESSNSLQAR